MIWPKKKEPVIVDQGANNRIKDKAYVRGWNTCLESCKLAYEQAQGSEKNIERKIWLKFRK